MIIRQFLNDTAAGAAPFLALSLIPLMGFTGAAVDYSRANATKAALQTAVDSTGLILSKEAQNLTGAALSSRITEVFNAQFSRADAQNVAVSYQFSAPQQGSFSLKLTASATVPNAAAGRLNRLPISRKRGRGDVTAPRGQTRWAASSSNRPKHSQ